MPSPLVGSTNTTLIMLTERAAQWVMRGGTACVWAGQGQFPLVGTPIGGVHNSGPDWARAASTRPSTAVAST
ncbi:hypothetical protein POF53_08365 [Mitsuaria sp. RG]|uniref:hypothetical protein n=1 Tax=Pseudomonas sp. DVZ6 TaxID=3050941 RepID=UPI002AA397EF|nr:hypothetical protein [Mitsuaria sp. RG]